jgi:quercetin dioxygenase-like cupin family protein
MSSTRKFALAAPGLAIGLASFVALAQTSGIKRTLMQRVDLQGHEAKECVLGSAEIPAGGSAGRHFHHGIEMGYVVEGESEILVDGEAPKNVSARTTRGTPAPAS